MRLVPRYTAAVFALSLLAACGDKAAAPGAPPAATVAVITVAPAAVTLSTELPGRTEASRIAQVRARTAGIVLQRVFKEGGDVKAGEVLFRIDPASFQASYDSAQAAVAKAEANLAQAELKVKRYKPLLAAQAVSQQEYDDAVTAQKQAAADLATSRAARTNAGLTLGYATVTSPISGRIGRALVTEGALVGQGEATPMATVQTLDPIYVTITQSSAELLRLQRALASGTIKGAGKNEARVTLVTEDGQAYPQAGKLLFSDVSVDESTGAVSMRAEFPNPQRTLLPGMYVRARLDQGVNDAAITVPQQAVVRSPDGSSVLIVGADNKVLAQPVTATANDGQNWVVSSGLKGGERIVVEGFQKAKPGATVNPQPWKGPVGTTPAAAAPAAAK
ncbi:efflux RND transporter periplasmic adaptor subunit [Duganella violaceipulchra]|uniref:Efflux RND transporter periplasmic adaptor subunit n=1 Tax=Duganella violaceipulchra TaxID=2849652 RepID=A0AA41H6F7_9BURK|nr:efflux RND transporter periplasmic adaptor subunit [Duganella violaceicalia]MBV6321224.1 efflux RND transporter periplasmic adaptor subunit [Duganella violaceicalia]MCP2009529.1 membrane fusion protein (multidrug efflux system) [Duganella violaceicalia]